MLRTLIEQTNNRYGESPQLAVAAQIKLKFKLTLAHASTPPAHSLTFALPKFCSRPINHFPRTKLALIDPEYIPKAKPNRLENLQSLVANYIASHRSAQGKDKMKLLTLNFLTRAIKTCKTSPSSFPLHPRDAELEIVEADVNLVFLKNILPRLMWSEIRGIAGEVR